MNAPDWTWLISVRTTGNQRGSPFKRIRIAKEQRTHAAWCAVAAECKNITPRAVRFTRIAPRELDSDNLQTSCKALRDGTADAFGCDDSKRSGIEWTYSQERGKPREYAVRCEVWL